MLKKSLRNELTREERRIYSHLHQHFDKETHESTRLKKMASKKRYSARDVLEFIWTPGSDPEMSDLEGREPESEEDILPTERIKRYR